MGPGVYFGWKFSGKVIPNNTQHASLSEFLRHLESYASLRGLPEQAKVELCRANLTGDAQKWFVAQADLEDGHFLAFVSDWELTRKYLKEQYMRVGPSYYLNTKGLYEQRGDEDAEQFYARIMTTLEEFMDR